MDRRQFVARAAIGAAGVWAAPVITSTPWAVAHASGSPCPGTSGRAYDFLALYSGPVSDNTGPVKEYPADPGSAATVNEPLPNNGLLQATTLSAMGGPTPASPPTPAGYATSAEVQGLQMTLGQFLPLPVTASATVLRTTASCLCGGLTPSTRTATIADLALNILGVTVVSPDPVVAPNTHAPGFPQTIIAGPASVLVDVLFNRQLKTVDGYDVVSALFVTLAATVPGAVTQLASFEFARSEVRCLAE